jgi:WD40 repeat protein
MTPDGSSVLSGSSNMSVSVWDLTSGRRKFVMEGHSGEICAVACSSDGRRAVSGGHDSKLIYWDLTTGKSLQTYEAGASLHGVAFSSDGKQVVAGCGHAAILWDVGSGTVLKTFEGHLDVVRGVSFCLSGTAVLTASYDHSVRVWDVASGKEKLKFLGHRGGVWCVACSPDGKTAASGGQEKQIVLWDVASGEVLRKIGPVGGNLYYVSFSADGKYLLSDAASPGAGIWDVETGKKLREFPGHRDLVASAAFSPDGRKVVTGSHDRTLAVWDAASGEREVPLNGHSSEVRSVLFSPTGGGLLTQSIDATLILWDQKTGTPLRRTSQPASRTLSAVFSRDGATVLSGGQGVVDSWDARTFNRNQGYSDPGLVNCLAVSPDGRTVLTGSGSQVRWREFDGGEVLMTLQGHEKEVYAVAFTPDGKRAVSGAADHAVAVWDLESGQRLRSLAGHGDVVLAVAVSPNGRLALSGGKDGVVFLWELETGRQLRRFEGHAMAVASVAFHPDGQTAASGSWDKSVAVWDLHSGKMVESLKGHVGSVTKVAFSPGGGLLASGSTDTSVVLWQRDGLPSAEGTDWASRWKGLRDPERAGVLKTLVDDLASVDLARSTSARARISALGEDALGLLSQAYLVGKADPAALEKELQQVLGKLDDDDPAVRQRAREDLRSKGATIQGWVERELRQGLTLSAEVRSSLETLRTELVKDPAAVQDLAQLRMALMICDRLPAPAAIKALKEISGSGGTAPAQEVAHRALSAFDDPATSAEARLREADQALARGEYDAAESAASEAEALSRSVGLKKSTALAAGLRQEAKRQRVELESALEARKTLDRSPDDPRANLSLGRYLCVMKDDWAGGSLRLAKSDVEEIRVAAKSELSKPSDAGGKAEAGDLWWEVAEKSVDRPFAAACRRRAGHWFSQAVEGLEGVDRVRVQGRLKELSQESSVDLLKLIDPARDAVQGEWALKDGVLEPTKPASPARVQIPYSPPEEYDLTLVAERTEGKESINLGLFGGGRQFQVVIDGWPTAGYLSSLWSLDGKDGSDNESTRRGLLLSNGHPATIICSVRKTGVKVAVDGKTIIDWKGNYERLTNPGLAKIPDPRAMSIGCYDVIYRFSRLTLTPVSGSGKVLR